VHSSAPHRARADGYNQRVTNSAPRLRALPTQAPDWMVRLLTPLIAKHVAQSLAREHPHLEPQAIAERMRADLGPAPDARALALVDAVERYLPLPAPPRVAGESSGVTTIALLAANLVPLYGVLALGWEVFPLMLLFWIENVVVGVLNVARMLCVDPRDPASWAAKLFLVPFFCFHYGMFTAVHGVFVFGLFGGHGFSQVRGLDVLGPAMDAVREYGLQVAVLALAASHLFSFLWNYLGRGEFRRASLSKLMAGPYSRVVVLHLAILGGGFAAAALGSPVWALVLLVALKVGFDLHAHLKEHRTAGATSGGAGLGDNSPAARRPADKV